MDHAATPADIGAMINARGNDGWGGNGMFGIIGLLAILGMFNGGFGGGWGNRGGNALTEADLCTANSFNELKSQVGRMNDQMFANARTSDNAICTLGYQSLEQNNAIQNAIQQCCCQLKQLIAEEGNATRAMIQQDKIEALQNKVNNLEMDQRFCGVPRLPLSFTYGVNPAALFNGFGNCNCNSNGLF